MVSVAANAMSSSSQIARISYKRPETWRWLFGVILMGGNTIGQSNSTLQVLLNVQTGVGRTVFTMELGRFVFNWAGDVPVFQDPLISMAGKKWSNNVNGPLVDDTLAATPPQNVVNTFVGEDVQVSCSSLFTSQAGGGGTAGKTVSFAVTALFAPEVHLRPEWHQGLFPGDEARGT